MMPTVFVPLWDDDANRLCPIFRMKARTADAIFVPFSDEDANRSRSLFANGVYSLLERGGALVDSDSNLGITYDVV